MSSASKTGQQILRMYPIIMNKCNGAEIISVSEMESNNEVWNDWIMQENEYAVGDRKSINAGAGKYLNFIAIVLRKK